MQACKSYVWIYMVYTGVYGGILVTYAGEWSVIRCAELCVYDGGVGMLSVCSSCRCLKRVS